MEIKIRAIEDLPPAMPAHPRVNEELYVALAALAPGMVLQVTLPPGRKVVRW